MAQDKLDILLRDDAFGCSVYYFASVEPELLRRCAARVRAALLAANGDAETTRIDGPAPDLGEVVAAAGVISFFGTPRVVEIKELMPSAMKDRDAEELGELFSELENAVLIISCLYKDKKAAGTKKAKGLFAAAQRAGYAAELAPPSRGSVVAMLEAEAARCAAAYEKGAAGLLVDRAGADLALLATETARLAAVAGYGTITREIVESHSVRNIEADVFQLAGFIAKGQRAAAHQKLSELFALRHEPLAIAGALAGSFVDMARVRAGEGVKRTSAAVARDFGYSNEWRVTKARDNARAYNDVALEDAVGCLAGLDRQLKSSALPDKTVLLQVAVDELIALQGR